MRSFERPDNWEVAIGKPEERIAKVGKYAVLSRSRSFNFVEPKPRKIDPADLVSNLGFGVLSLQPSRRGSGDVTDTDSSLNFFDSRIREDVDFLWDVEGWSDEAVDEAGHGSTQSSPRVF